MDTIEAEEAKHPETPKIRGMNPWSYLETLDTRDYSKFRKVRTGLSREDHIYGRAYDRYVESIQQGLSSNYGDSKRTIIFFRCFLYELRMQLRRLRQIKQQLNQGNPGLEMDV